MSYRDIFEHHPQPMWLCAVESLRIIAANAAAARAYGYDRTELLAMSATQLFPEADGARIPEILTPHVEGRKTVAGCRQIAADGRLFTVDLHTVPIGTNGSSSTLVIAEHRAEAGTAKRARPTRAGTFERALRRAVERHEIGLAYQPIVDAKSGMVVSLEALARWNDAEGEPVEPDQFIPIAEELGLIGRLGESLMHRACERMRGLVDAGYDKLSISVNISAQQLREPTFARSVQAILEEADLEARYLQLEITESAYIGNADAVTENMESLKAQFVRMSIDDFGTGYSSLGYLKRLPVDTLKIDRSFVAEILTNQVDQTIAGAIVNVAKSLGLTVVAEGVETPAQAIHLRRLGCHQLQGFYFGRPLSDADLDQYLKRPTKLANHG